jgi:hypothetical protein
MTSQNGCLYNNARRLLDACCDGAVTNRLLISLIADTDLRKMFMSGGRNGNVEGGTDLHRHWASTWTPAARAMCGTWRQRMAARCGVRCCQLHSPMATHCGQLPADRQLEIVSRGELCERARRKCRDCRGIAAALPRLSQTMTKRQNQCSFMLN